MGKEDDNKQRKIFPAKKPGEKHRTEEDPSKEATKPVTDPNSHPKKPNQN